MTVSRACLSGALWTNRRTPFLRGFCIPQRLRMMQTVVSVFRTLLYGHGRIRPRTEFFLPPRGSDNLLTCRHTTAILCLLARAGGRLGVHFLLTRMRICLFIELGCCEISALIPSPLPRPLQRSRLRRRPFRAALPRICSARSSILIPRRRREESFSPSPRQRVSLDSRTSRDLKGLPRRPAQNRVGPATLRYRRPTCWL
jgi:hypothetical protein